ncbi:MAG: zinc ribbon domain-containing protein [Spirochaetales bacterium]|nr:zinc ribbon domain-containing protein [Spirochaetales bacterium]
MKEPSFYCENCGDPVALKATSCPSCGKRFDAVKCPECAFSGRSDLFLDGCPSCGFLNDTLAAVNTADAGMLEADIKKRNKVYGFETEEKSASRSALPGWAYGLITVGLVGFLIFLLIMYLTLD